MLYILYDYYCKTCGFNDAKYTRTQIMQSYLEHVKHTGHKSSTIIWEYNDRKRLLTEDEKLDWIKYMKGKKE